MSDNGTQLVSNEVETFLERNGIHHVTSPPYHPASNGAAENTVKSFKRGMKAALLDPKNAGVDPDVLVARYLLLYRNAVHSTTKQTPAKLMINRQVRTLFDIMRPVANEGKRNLSKPEQQKFAINEKVLHPHERDRTTATKTSLKTTRGKLQQREVDNCVYSETSCASCTKS